MTALALAPDTRVSYEPAAAARVDRTIRVSTAIAVLAVASVAAYVSYWHAYAVVCAHGETGVTARLEPATIDGLVYASSMVNLYAARHRLPVPALARWLLALGIVATLAANMAQGWSHGPVGAVIAAWPAVSLVGSYELLVWIIRTAAGGDPDHGLVAYHRVPHADQSGTSLWPADAEAPDPRPADPLGQSDIRAPQRVDGPLPVVRAADADRESGPDWYAADQADQATPDLGKSSAPGTDKDINVAAVAAYHASVQVGSPLSERKLAGMFGKTSRQWARSRMAEARQSPVRVPG
jgi:Protein of unknown function (DUF2637)